MQNSEIRAEALKAALMYFDVTYRPGSDAEIYKKADQFADYIHRGRGWKPETSVDEDAWKHPRY